jgi:zinc protease
VKVQAELAKASLENQNASPDFAFSRTFTAVRTQDHLRRRVTTDETIDEWNLSKSMAFYKDRFADASDFTFVFVGSFDLPAMKPFVERYIASLPSTKRKETWKDVGVRTPPGVVEKNVEKGIEPRSRSTIQFNGTFTDTETNRITLQAMAQILNRRLFEVIREELGSAYTISAGAGVQRIPRPEYSVTIQLGHDPLQTPDLMKRIFQEIESFKAKGPTDIQVKDQREMLLRAFETSIKQNNYLLNEISQRYRFGEEPSGIWSLPDVYRKLDAAAIQQAARTYLNMERYVRVTLLPEQR